MTPSADVSRPVHFKLLGLGSIFRPQTNDITPDGTHAYGSLSDQISNLFQGVALSIVSLVEWVLLHLTFAEHQRAEYNADAHATRVAGTTAKIQLLRKLLIIPRTRRRAIHSLSGYSKQDRRYD